MTVSAQSLQMDLGNPLPPNTHSGYSLVDILELPLPVLSVCHLHPIPYLADELKVTKVKCQPRSHSCGAWTEYKFVKSVFGALTPRVMVLRHKAFGW